MNGADDYGFVGEIREVNTHVIETATQNGYVPIIATVAGGYHGETYNINADVAAARIAASLGACKLLLMTDVCGLLRDKDDESTIIPVVNVSEVPKLKREKIISGGMIPKIDCCVGSGAPRRTARPHYRTAGCLIRCSSNCSPMKALAPCFIKKGRHRHEF